MSKYKYILEEDFHYQLEGIRLEKDFMGKDKKGRLWVFITQNGILGILKGYAWDGATLAPDYPEIYEATLVHDALYQFLERGMPLSRKQIDDIFLKMMENQNFKYAKIYYRAVRLFGGIFVKLTR